jgi:hypothetical protein
MSTVRPRLFSPSCSAWIENGRLRMAAACSLFSAIALRRNVPPPIGLTV